MRCRHETKLLIVGGFQDRKGYDVLLNALKILNRPDVRLVGGRVQGAGGCAEARE